MTRLHQVLPVVLLVALVAARGEESSPAPPPETIRESLRWRHQEEIRHEYLVLLPDHYHDAPAEKRWPLLVYLHGGGGNETSVRKRLAPLRSRPFVILAPICPPSPRAPGGSTNHGTRA